MPPYTSSIQVLNGSDDITSIVEFDSTFNIQAVLTKEKGQFQFNVKAPQAPTLPANMPVVGDTIYVNYTINGNKVLLFGGTLVTSEPIVSGGLVLIYQMTAVDWSYALDAYVVKANYADEDPHDIAVNLMESFAPEGMFTTNHVQVGNFNVSTIQFNYQQLSKALQALATQIGWDWFIDADRDLHFYFAEGNAASSSEVIQAPIVIDDTTGDIEWPTLDVQVDITNMKNAVYVVGGTYQKDFVLSPNPNATPPQYTPIDTYQTDGVQIVFPLSYSYDESTLTITLGGVGQSIGTAQVTDPTTVEVLYDDSGRFIQFTTTPSAGQTIVVQGEANVPILAYVTDQDSITTYGIREDAISDTKILSVQQAQERAQADIDMFGDPVYTVKFNTISAFTNQLSIGQQIKLNSPKFGVSNKLLIIKQINFVARTPTQLEAQVQCLGSGSVSYNDIMLQLLQQNLGSESTPASTVLQTLIPIDEELEITDTVILIGASRPYVWGPVPSAVQYPEGGATYGSFGYASAAYAAGLPYADDAPIANSSPEAVWSFFTWS
jgi:hypothetical protein